MSRRPPSPHQRLSASQQILRDHAPQEQRHSSASDLAMTLDDLQLLEDLHREAQEPVQVEREREREREQEEQEEQAETAEEAAARETRATFSASAASYPTARAVHPSAVSPLLSSSLHGSHRIPSPIAPVGSAQPIEVEHDSVPPAIPPAQPAVSSSHRDFSSKLLQQTDQVIAHSQQLVALQTRLDRTHGSAAEERKKYEHAILPLVRRSAERADTVLKGALRRTSLELNGAVLTLQRQLIAEKQKNARLSEQRRRLEMASEIAQRDASTAKAYSDTLEQQMRALAHKSDEQNKYILEFETKLGVGGADADGWMQARKKIAQLTSHLAAANEATSAAKAEATKAMLVAEEQRAYIDVLKRALELRVAEINAHFGSHPAPATLSRPPFDHNPHPAAHTSGHTIAATGHSGGAREAAKKERVLDGISNRTAAPSASAAAGAVVPLHITKYSLVELAARSCKAQLEQQLQRAVAEKEAAVEALKEMNAKYQARTAMRTTSRRREASSPSKRQPSATRSSTSRSPARSLSRSPTRVPKRSPSRSPARPSPGTLAQAPERASSRSPSRTRANAAAAPTPAAGAPNQEESIRMEALRSLESQLKSDYARKEALLLEKARSLDHACSHRMEQLKREHQRAEQQLQRRMQATMAQQSEASARVTQEYRQRVEVTLEQLQAEQAEKSKLLDFVEELSSRAAALDLAAGEARGERDMWEMQARELAGLVEEQGAKEEQQREERAKRNDSDHNEDHNNNHSDTHTTSSRRHSHASSIADVRDDVISTLEHQVASLQQKLAAADQECRTLDQRVTELECELARAQQPAADDSAGQTRDSLADSATPKEDDDRRLAVKLAGLEEELRGTQLHRDTLHSQLMSLQVAHNTLTSESIRTSAELQARTAAHDALTGQYALCQTERMELTREIAALQQQLAAAASSHAHALAEAHNEVHLTRHSLITRHSEELAQLRQDGVDEKRGWEDGIQRSLHQQITSLRESSLTMELAQKHDLAIVHHAKRDAEAQAARAWMAREEAEEETRRARETLTDLRRAHEDAMAQQRHQWEQLVHTEAECTRAAEDQLAKEKAQVVLLSARLRANEDTIQALKTDLAEAHTDSLRPQEELARERAQMEEWRRKCAQAQTQVEQYGHALTMLEAQLAEYKLEVESEHHQLQTNVYDAAKRAAQAELHADKAQQELLALRQSIHLEQSDATSSVHRLREECAAKENEIRDLEVRAKAHEHQASDRRRQIQELQGEVERAKQQATQMDQLVREKDAAIHYLRARLEIRSAPHPDQRSEGGSWQAATTAVATAAPLSSAASFRAAMATKEREEAQLNGRGGLRSSSASGGASQDAALAHALAGATPLRANGYTTTFALDASYSSTSYVPSTSANVAAGARPISKVDERLNKIKATFAALRAR